MITPELGTAPRADVTGLAKYSAKPVNPLLEYNLGITRGNIAALEAFNVPWGALEIKWDFQESLFPEVLEYRVGLSTDPQMKDAAPGGGELPGSWRQVVISDNRGTPIPLQPNTQYYLAVWLWDGVGYIGETSEVVGMATAHLPSATSQNGPIGSMAVANIVPPVDDDPASLGTVDLTITGAPNPVTGSPVFDYRLDFGNGALVSAEAIAVGAAYTAGDYVAKGYITDEAGETTVVGVRFTMPKGPAA